MAKGLRSSVKKANKARLRAQVFGPVEEARKERLSAKLLALAAESKEKPDRTDAQMDVEEGETRARASQRFQDLTHKKMVRDMTRIPRKRIREMRLDKSSKGIKTRVGNGPTPCPC